MSRQIPDGTRMTVTGGWQWPWYQWNAATGEWQASDPPPAPRPIHRVCEDCPGCMGRGSVRRWLLLRTWCRQCGGLGFYWREHRP
jgi:hypothetical protein